jgi:hypothetical protein
MIEKRAVILTGITMDKGASLIFLLPLDDSILSEFPKNAVYTIGKK